jgi:CDP-glucose 4,6-dehydratase
MKENVFVTGADGFVGAHLCKMLLERGYNVVGLVHDHKPMTTLDYLGVRDKIVSVYGDICDREMMKRIISDYQVKRVFHLAAQAIVSIAQKDPLNTFKVNVEGTACILDACIGMDLKSILSVSTDKVYGEGMNRVEEDKLNAKGIYEVSKVCMDCVSRCYSKIYDLPLVVSRACNIYGEYDPNRRIIPNTILDLKNNKSPLIFKNDDSIREFIYVEDVCDAYIFLSENIDKTAEKAFNVGSGSVHKQDEVVKLCIKVSGKNIEPVIKEKKTGIYEIYQQTVDSTKIRKLGWKPKYNLESGLAKTWQNWKLKN